MLQQAAEAAGVPAAFGHAGSAVGDHHHSRTCGSHYHCVAGGHIQGLLSTAERCGQQGVLKFPGCRPFEALHQSCGG